VERLKCLHEAGFVHGDLKLHNMCFGTENDDTEQRVHLIDFGSSFKIYDAEGKHKTNSNDRKFAGNLMFASMNIC
jgi:tRNA A-37 threonylcarbamoyl transferase component Bud32